MRDVVNYYGAVGVAIIHGCQGLVTFLTSGIPESRGDKLDDRSHGRKGIDSRERAAGDPHQISNLMVVVSSRAMVCVKNAAPIVDSR